MRRHWTMWAVPSLAALGLIAWAAIAYFTPSSGRQLTAQQADRQLGSLPAGQEYSVEFVFDNAGSGECRVIGASFT